MPNTRQRITHIIDAWKVALSDKAFTMKLVIAPAIFLAYSFVTQGLGAYVEARKGIHLKDQFLNYFPSIDFSVAIFLLLYGSILTFILLHLDKPRIIFRFMEMHFLVALVRQICILMFALEPPHGIIILKDVFLENTFYPHDTPLTKDLFFSGHAASIWIYFLCAQKKYFKIAMLFATFVMSYMILCMRIHYSYDIYGAIIITSIIYFTPSLIRNYYAKVKEQIT
jgi:hypothetical protein